VWGLTFKAGTDDLRDSPAVTLVNSLVSSGATVRAYDPTVELVPPAHKAAVLAGVEIVATAIEAAKGADVVVIATEWPEFAAPDLAQLAATMTADPVIVDTRNILAPDVARAAGLRYGGVGRR